MIHAVITGIGGRMGRAVASVVGGSEGISITGATEREGSEFIGRDIGELAGSGVLGRVVCEDLLQALSSGEGDVIIDFTAPDATRRHLAVAVRSGTAMVIGTTGLGKEGEQEVREAARRIPVVFSPNMSVGINLMLRLVEISASALGGDYDIEVVEAHHRLKRDAPSGTALKLAEVLAEAAGRDLARDGVFCRKGMIGERKRGSIGIQAIRAGDIVGDHTVLFGGDGERLEITHRASSRETFARGAVRAALWVCGREPGLYSMGDVLGFPRTGAGP